MTQPGRGRTAGERRINLVQGEQHVASDPDVVLTTILGSCVAACLRDPVAGVGGMNHFLLPGSSGGGEGAHGIASLSHGVHAMELLMNALLHRGAQRQRLQAKLFGGASMTKGLTNVGTLNAGFAERFLRDEGIVTVGGSLRGSCGRRVQFWPVSGRARLMMLGAEEGDVFHAERVQAVAEPGAASGLVELF